MRLLMLALCSATLCACGSSSGNSDPGCIGNTDCAADQICDGGQCVVREACPNEAQTLCGDQCVNTQSDVDHCGSCSACPDLENARAVACVEGACQYICEGGYQDTDGDLDQAPQGSGCECPPGEACSTCPEDCGPNEVCRQGTCVVVECTDDATCALPAPSCDGQEVVTWIGTGTCQNNTCDRTRVAQACTDTQICQNATCVDVECTADDQCRTPQNECQGDRAIYYDPAQGRCQDNTCVYLNPDTELCTDTQRVCQQGRCTDLCDALTCDGIDPPYCEENMRVVPTAAACEWQTGQCVPELTMNPCPSNTQCQQGLCVPSDTSLIPSGVTQFSLYSGDFMGEIATNTITRSFFMQKQEVTRALYLGTMGTDPSTYEDGNDTPQHPVNQVGFLDVTRFANALSLRDDLPVCYQNTGLSITDNVTDCAGWRLPTLEEWRHAYRAGTDTPWFCGEDASCLETTARCDGSGQISPVRQQQPNAWGLYDMAGNVSEWVHDSFLEFPQPFVYTDWAGDPNNHDFGSIAGGSAASMPESCQADSIIPIFKSEDEDGSRSQNAGFRLVRTLLEE